MGQVCSGAKEEAPKGGLLDIPSQSQAGDYADSEIAQQQQQQTADSKPETPAIDGDNDGETEDKRASSAALADLERRKRRELWIVNGAARGMVAVRSTRGSTGYYDQGFAGLLAQHLEQTTSFPDQLPLVLPDPAPLKQQQQGQQQQQQDDESPPSPSKKKKSFFYDRLAEPAWEGMELVVEDPTSSLRGREASAAVSGDPFKLMDALAESLLDGPYTVLPSKQQLFAGVKPMVENLL
eukprot:CAMPEP_0116134668 /NCGR_PEP_ID=MMETSP0329-20121206/10774_1 /TAXON_ID=697910 /ORGANISM="Pseudo-nitzschia arenysensis, Strain B593" /LENGTH=237 /DNA_ID=CAMNT_0003629405 /DNA_START=190 /DNA_END=906 /DNA_ORIENTATION=+